MSDDLSITFAALADPTRRAILERLTAGELSVTELAEPFEMSLPAISKHLKVLERAGLIERRIEAQRRPAQLNAAPLIEVAAWVAPYRNFWDESAEGLVDRVRELPAEAEYRVNKSMVEQDPQQAAEKPKKKKKGKKRQTS